MNKPQCELTNMIMIQDSESGKVVVINRCKSWVGLSFPGGHVENGESFYDSAVREVYEETGLTVNSLELCGIINWYNTETSERYLVYLYRTSDFTGELIKGTEEGEVFWMSPEDFDKYPDTNSFKDYLPLFFGEKPHEAFGKWNIHNPGIIVEYK